MRSNSGIPLETSCENRRWTMGSFYNNARAVDAIIKSSQAEWKRGYEMGKKKGASLSDQKLLSRNYSAQFRDGHRRGRNELLGIPPEPLKLAPPRNLTPEEIAKEQYDRGFHLAGSDEELSEKTLSGCHPDFVKGYLKAKVLYEPPNWCERQLREDLARFGSSYEY